MKILHDVHIHNFLSTCSNDNRATVESYIEIERRQGIRLMGFANHTWDETVPLPVADYDFYRRQSLSFQQQIRPQIPADTGELKVLVGAETEYCGMFDCLGMSPEGARRLDFLLIPHSHTHMTDFVMPASENLPLAQEAIAKKLAETVVPHFAHKSCRHPEAGQSQYGVRCRSASSNMRIHSGKYLTDLLVSTLIYQLHASPWQIHLFQQSVVI